MRYIFIVLIITFSCSAWAQNDEMLLPLTGNPVLKNYKHQTKHNTFQRKSGITDTLLLPFFDDFSKRAVFPDSNKWTDKQAYINTDFPVRPPSIGVATMDGLDSTGRPYLNIRADLFGGNDTLTSQPIDISTYTALNSIYLSFFYQAQGQSFFQLAARDSLVVQFKDKNGNWRNVWKNDTPHRVKFKPAIIGVQNADDFHAGFQFRFINYQNYLGGLGQWHIDYVYMERNRGVNDTLFNDVALQKRPESILKDYQEMPYSHYKGNEAAENRNQPFGRLSNLANVGRTINTFNREVKDNFGNTVINSQRSGLALNAYSDSGYDFPSTVTPVGINADTVIYNVTEYLKIAGANTNLANDSFTRSLTFGNHFAYDDGTAETGYGIRRGPGKIAYGFRLNKPDTLRAISVYFFQAEDTIKRAFQLAVWRSISPNGTGEELLYRQLVLQPVYTDSINGFHTFVLDTPQLVQNTFYIGWIQPTEFMLNVGFDRNYLSNAQSGINPLIYFNTTGKWFSSAIAGTIMMRPHVGKVLPDTTVLSVHEPVKENRSIKVYPNPTSNVLNFEFPGDGEFTFDIRDIAGRTVLTGAINTAEKAGADVSPLPSGLYFIILRDTQRQEYYSRFIKQ